MSEIRIGLIGAGGRCNQLIDQVPAPGKIVAASDCFLYRVTETQHKKKTNWKLYQDYRKMFEAEKLDAKKVTRVLACSGKIYYELLAHRRDKKIGNIAIIRLEQQYPFPHDDFSKALEQFPKAKEVVWVQEEPQNQGAWYRLRAYLRADAPDEMVLAYAGRPISASPAVGYAAKHNAEQKQVIEDAFAPELKSGEMVVAH